MAVAADHFEQTAAAVASRAAELLSARVSVIDEFGAEIVSRRPQDIGLTFEARDDEPGATCLHVPMQLGAQVAEVVVSTPVNGEIISPRLAQGLVELIVTQATVVSRLPNQRELKDKLIHDVLHGPIDDEADVVRQGQILGMDFRPPRAVILINAADFILPRQGSRLDDAEARMRRRAEMVIASVVGFFKLPNDTICAYIGGGEVAVLKASSTQDLVAWTNGADGLEYVDASWANLAALKRASSALLARLRHDTGSTAVSIGIGRYHPTVRGLTRSYDDARAALSLGRRFHGQNQVYCLDSLGIAAFVGISDERTKIDLAAHLLSPLDQEPELLETLDVFFDEDCCPSSSAKRLIIHRNTLSYRLAKIASLTGLDPRHFDDAVQMRLALALRSLCAERG